MSKPVPARYRTTNWSEYKATLRWRGSLLVWLDREMEWCAPKRGRPGRPETFSDAAIQFYLSLKVLFGLALRQTIGMVASLLKMAGLEAWPVPDYSSDPCRPPQPLHRPWHARNQARYIKPTTVRDSSLLGRIAQQSRVRAETEPKASRLSG